MALVEAGAWNGNRISTSRNLNGERIYRIACSHFEPQRELMRSAPSAQFHQDPVSQIPELCTSGISRWHSALEDSIEVLGEANCLLVGHVNQGTRHSTCAVDVSQLMAYGIKVQERIEAAIGLARVQLDGAARPFLPRYVLYPSSLQRTAQGARDEVREHNGAKLLADFVRDYVGATDTVEVARVLDGRGMSHCSHGGDSRFGEGQLGEDVIIVDEEIYSGRTLKAICNMAITARCKRVMLLALVARVAPVDMDFWTGVISFPGAMKDDCNASTHQVALATPLYLPIPYFSSASCPYDRTRARLERFEGVAPASVRRLQSRLSEPPRVFRSLRYVSPAGTAGLCCCL